LLTEITPHLLASKETTTLPPRRPRRARCRISSASSFTFERQTSPSSRASPTRSGSASELPIRLPHPCVRWLMAWSDTRRITSASSVTATTFRLNRGGRLPNPSLQRTRQERRAAELEYRYPDEEATRPLLLGMQTDAPEREVLGKRPPGPHLQAVHVG